MVEDKITILEYIVIIAFSIIMLLTLNYPLSMYLGLVTLGIGTAIQKLYKKKAFIKRHSSKLFYSVIIMFILDTLSTYYSVIYKGFAVEGNQFVLFLWDKLGYTIGEDVRIIMFLGILLVTRYHTKHKLHKRRFAGFIFLIFINLLWVAVLINNFYWLFFP
jgi:hypothetical protein